MPSPKPYSSHIVLFVLVCLYALSYIHAGLAILFTIGLLFFFKDSKSMESSRLQLQRILFNLSTQSALTIKKKIVSAPDVKLEARALVSNLLPITFFSHKRLVKRKKYLHIALNNTLTEAEDIIPRLPTSDRILIEVGTPLLKIYGIEAISRIKALAPIGVYIVADNKCADLAQREVEMVAQAGANAATCLGVAPIETINSFIFACQKFNIDSMLDMMNVSDSQSILKKLKKLPDVVILHRGVDETEFSKDKHIPYYQIKQIKGSYNVLVAVAGGDTIKEVERAVFNDSDIVVVWKDFYKLNTDTAQLAETFLKQIK